MDNPTKMPMCDNCGQENRPEARFCRTCGTAMMNLDATAKSPGSGHGASSPPATVTVPRAATAETSTTPGGHPPEPGVVESLAAGAILLDRYHVCGMLETRGDVVTYEAEDILSCPDCGALQPEAGQRFCETCGAEFTKFTRVGLRALPGVQAAVGGASADVFQHDGTWYQVEPLPAQPAEEQRAACLSLSVARLSHAGLKRDANEDSLLVIHSSLVSEGCETLPLALLALADGMGGFAAGEIASRTALASLGAEVMQHLLAPALSTGSTLVNLQENLGKAVQVANQAVLAEGACAKIELGCTLTAAVLLGNQMVTANVGDSRIYRLRAGGMQQLTRDHSVIANLLASGTLLPQDAGDHHQKGVLVRSLGDKKELEVDVEHFELQPGDRVLLCCDGLWDMVEDELIRDVLVNEPSPMAACSRLLALANLAGGDDNISLIIADVNGVPSPEVE